MSRIAMISGGAKGIGLGIARELASNGFDLSICGRSSEVDAAAALSELKACGVRVVYTGGCDISTPEGRDAFIASTLTELGVPDVLVNNAGVAPNERRDILEMAHESFDRVLGINLRGPFFLTQDVARLMIANKAEGFRCIVNIGSVSADYASVNRGEYCISKAGVSMATKLWAARLAEYGISVYEVRPGIVHSDMTSVVTEKYDKLIAGGLTVQKRWGEPADVGRAVAALASGAFGYSTGQVINVDGGMTLPRL